MPCASELAMTKIFEYWDNDVYKEFPSEAQTALRACPRNTCSVLLGSNVFDGSDYVDLGGYATRSVVIKELTQVTISNTFFPDGSGSSRHVRLKPPAKGDAKVCFIYKDPSATTQEGADNNYGWKKVPDDTQHELRRCFAQHPLPQHFNVCMHKKAYSIFDFHKVDDTEAYMKVLAPNGSHTQTVRMNEKNVVQKKLCVFAFKGMSKAQLLEVIMDGAEINVAAEVGGLTPLGFAVAANRLQAVEDLISLKAHVNMVIRENTTALTLALGSKSCDGTEMVRSLLAQGADPNQMSLLDAESQACVGENVSMCYWLERARKRPVTELRMERLQNINLERLPKLEYAVVGQEAAVRYIIQRIRGFYHPPYPGKPLVTLALGPPGHGKTEFTRRLAAAIASDHHLLEVSCSMLRDDADLFGSRLGGYQGTKYASQGQLIKFLREHYQERGVVLLDEFEKIRELTSALGWRQDKKIYSAFLEPWQEGVITDRGAGDLAGSKISVFNKVFVITSNLCQDKILEFAQKHAAKMASDVSERDASWVQRELVKKELLPCLLRFFKDIDPELQALVSRIDCIVPFLPFSVREQHVVADMELRKFFAEYRNPPQMEGPLEERRPIGHLMVVHTPQVAELAASSYDRMEGARSMQRMARDLHGKLVELHLDGTLDNAEQINVQKQRFAKVYASTDGDSVQITLEPPPQPSTICQEQEEEAGNPAASHDDTSDDGNSQQTPRGTGSSTHYAPQWQTANGDRAKFSKAQYDNMLEAL
eukprot:TRINITY_DN43151_c0_g1_i1.p1 TRINITY_DN43151_c0_g1~~TRINITY_DN43151_c0_g1_i1.p1  ORF type:complete len:763 (-),score=151.31 TRINITY_DN43151_c0_g1_i1:148-2436(-)